MSGRSGKSNFPADKDSCDGTNRKLINHKVGRFLNFIRSNGDSKGFVHTIKQILNEKGEINNHG